ncbi:hypothetical protein [Amycolatopsis panacis]|nr:hypothetical protein [Amycolatopsis panacis]
MSARTLLIAISAAVISAVPSIGVAVLAWVAASAALSPMKAMATAVTTGVGAFVLLVMMTGQFLHRLTE